MLFRCPLSFSLGTDIDRVLSRSVDVSMTAGVLVGLLYDVSIPKYTDWNEL